MSFSNPTIEEFKSYFSRDFPYGIDPTTHILDADIAKAFGQTNVNLNEGLFGTQEEYTIAYMFLSAHWLVIDIRMSSQGLADGGFGGILNSKSVGSVSASYQIPQRFLDNPEFAFLASTNYGAKYLQLVLPRIAGQSFTVRGSTRP